LDNNFVSRLKMPENNFYLLRMNIRHDYKKIAGVRMVLGNTGAQVIEHPTKLLSHNRLHHSGVRVFEINMKTEILWILSVDNIPPIRNNYCHYTSRHLFLYRAWLLIAHYYQ